MLILQGTAHYGVLISAVLTIMITTVFAYLSWRFIENPALQFKNLLAERVRPASPSLASGDET